jgi:hypothetical protein
MRIFTVIAGVVMKRGYLRQGPDKIFQAAQNEKPWLTTAAPEGKNDENKTRHAVIADRGGDHCILRI